MTRTALAMDDRDDVVVPVEFDDEAKMVRRTKVMFLRNHGKTWSVIAQVLGISESTARKDYSVVCRDLNNEAPADVVARHRAVIFDIQRANYPKMMAGDKDAAQTILKALDREAKLLGLDAPTRILASVNDVEYANEAARLIESIQALDADTLKELTRAQSAEFVIDAELVDQGQGAATAPQEPQDVDGPAGQWVEPDPGPSTGSAPGPEADPDGQAVPEAHVGDGTADGTLGQDQGLRHGDDPAAGLGESEGRNPYQRQRPVNPLDGWSNIG